MKKLIILISVFSLSICGTVYLSMDASSSWDIDGCAKVGLSDCDNDFDSSITLGYNHPVYQQDNLGIAVGASMMVKKLEDDIDKNPSTSDEELDFLSIYVLPTYKINDELSAWFSLGYNKMSFDSLFDQFLDAENGLTYGFGVHYKMTEQMGFGLGYITHKGSLKANSAGNAVFQALGGVGSVDLDVEVTRLALHASYSF